MLFYLTMHFPHFFEMFRSQQLLQPEMVVIFWVSFGSVRLFRLYRPPSPLDQRFHYLLHLLSLPKPHLGYFHFQSCSHPRLLLHLGLYFHPPVKLQLLHQHFVHLLDLLDFLGPQLYVIPIKYHFQLLHHRQNLIQLCGNFHLSCCQVLRCSFLHQPDLHLHRSQLPPHFQQLAMKLLTLASDQFVNYFELQLEHSLHFRLQLLVVIF